jgi:two-component system, cell cycle response regulator DivK
MDASVPNSERILVVEDDRESQAGLYSLLRGRGYSVLTADDGQQALDLLERGIRPRLIVLDLSLPKVSGPEVLRYLQSDPILRYTHVIVLTGRENARASAVDIVFQKPIDMPPFLSTIDRLMQPPQDARG